MNYRYAPDRSPAEAEARIRELAEAAGADELAIPGNSPAAPVVADAPLVRGCARRATSPSQPKQAWTPVAEFAAAGVDASTSARARPRTRTAATSRSRSPRSCARYDVLHAFLSDTV